MHISLIEGYESAKSPSLQRWCRLFHSVVGLVPKGLQDILKCGRRNGRKHLCRHISKDPYLAQVHVAAFTFL